MLFSFYLPFLLILTHSHTHTHTHTHTCTRQQTITNIYQICWCDKMQIWCCYGLWIMAVRLPYILAAFYSRLWFNFLSLFRVFFFLFPLFLSPSFVHCFSLHFLLCTLFNTEYWIWKKGLFWERDHLNGILYGFLSLRLFPSLPPSSQWKDQEFSLCSHFVSKHIDLDTVLYLIVRWINAQAHTHMHVCVWVCVLCHIMRWLM